MLLRSFVAVFFCCALLVGRTWAEPLPTLFLDKSQIAQLYQAACSEQPRPTDLFGKGNFVCDVTNYPGDAPRNPNLCSIIFRADDDGRFDIFYGQFLAPRLQALAMYYGGCEPHSNYYGGMALFDVIDGKFKFVRFIRAHVYKECVVLPPGKNGLQTLYCRDWYMNQGETGESFGPVTFDANGGAKFERWYGTHNADGNAGPAVPCIGKVEAHHMEGMRVDEAKSAIVLELAVRPRKLVEQACRRYRRRDFSAEEKQRRQDFPSLQGQGLLTPEEDALVTKEIRFTPPNKTPKISR